MSINTPSAFNRVQRQTDHVREEKEGHLSDVNEGIIGMQKQKPLPLVEEGAF
jgi:hypothetical protein